MNDNQIAITSLSKIYSNGLAKLEVLRDINLTVKQNEFVGILGPSGAGKSTLLHIIGGLDNKIEGKVLCGGTDIYRLNENERALFRNRKVGFVFQFYHLLPELNVLENVLLPAMLKSWWTRKKTAVYANELLARLGLSGRLNHRPKELSGGEQQRVAIARAIINRPQILLCDEPTGNLDSDNGKNIIGLLKQLHQEEKMTILLVTHDNQIAANADRLIYLKDGMVLN